MVEHSHDYKAFYVGAEHGTVDEIRDGVQWLRDFPGHGDGLLVVPTPDHLTRDAVIEVLPALKLGQGFKLSDRWIKPVAHRGSFLGIAQGPVLTLWPDDFLGDLHALAGKTALCVVPRFLRSIQAWISGMRAVDIRTGKAAAPPRLDRVVEQAMLDLITFANPVNRLIQTEEKAKAINMLETLRDASYQLEPLALESWMIGRGRPLDEAGQLAEYATGANDGKRYRIDRWSRRTAASILDQWQSNADAL